LRPIRFGTEAGRSGAGLVKGKVKLCGLRSGDTWLYIVLMLVGPGFGWTPPITRVKISLRDLGSEEKRRRTRKGKGRQQTRNGKGPLTWDNAMEKKMMGKWGLERFHGCFDCRLRQK
jgi:hypothetical protein